MKERAVCARCHRERYVDRMKPIGGATWKGAPMKCGARTSCTVARRKAARTVA